MGWSGSRRWDLRSPPVAAAGVGRRGGVVTGSVAKPGARNYSWPPFEAGNAAAVQHGAYSPRRVDPLAADILASVEPTVTW